MEQEQNGIYAPEPESTAGSALIMQLTAREMLDTLINRLAEARQQVEALRASLPNQLSEEAIAAYKAVFRNPEIGGNAIGIKFSLALVRQQMEQDIERLVALRRNLPEEFADPLAEEGLALLLGHFNYNT